MKKIVILGIGASMFFLGSCVESSQKYKSLQARLDSLSTVHIKNRFPNSKVRIKASRPSLKD